VNAVRAEQEPVALVPIQGGAVTYISAEDLAAVEAAGGTTVGVAVANERHLHTDCPDCDDGASA
jgi:hypothetical protein